MYYYIPYVFMLCYMCMLQYFGKLGAWWRSALFDYLFPIFKMYSFFKKKKKKSYKHFLQSIKIQSIKITRISP